MKTLIQYPNGKDCELYKVPEGVETIAPYAFGPASLLKKIELPEGLRSIGKEAFQNTHIEDIKLPSSITIIEDSTFRQSKLCSITFPTSLSRINDFAFCDCRSLKIINLPEGLVHIGKSAFCFGYALEKVYIPSSMQYIGRGAFGWNNLKELHIKIEDIEVFGDDFTGYIKKENCSLYVPYGTKYAYSNHPYFKDFSEIITED